MALHARMVSALKTPGNMIRTGERVINLPSVGKVDVVNRLAPHRLEPYAA